MNVELKSRWPRRILLAAGLLLLLGVLVVSGPREPVYQGRNLRYWTLRLAVSDPQATVAIRAIGPPAVPRLIAWLDYHGTLGRRLTDLFTPTLPVKAARQLQPKAGSEDPWSLRSTAAKALGILGRASEPAVPRLARALQEPQLQIQWEAAGALGQIGSAAAPALMRALTNADPTVRHAATFALGEMGPQAALAAPDLVRMLQDTNVQIRESAVYSLSQIGVPALPGLLAALDEHATPPGPGTPTDLASKEAAARVLVKLNESLQTAVPALVKLADSPTATTSVRTQALETLTAIRPADGRTLRVLKEALHDPADSIRLTAIHLLSRVGWRQALVVADLTVCLADASPAIRAGAAVALGNIGPAAKPALPALEKLAAAAEEPEEVRAAAREAGEKLRAGAVN
jgi:HEAT repeat protein